MPLVKRADKINETRNAGGITAAAAVAVAKGNQSEEIARRMEKIVTVRKTEARRGEAEPARDTS